MRKKYGFKPCSVGYSTPKPMQKNEDLAKAVEGSAAVLSYYCFDFKIPISEFCRQI